MLRRLILCVVSSALCIACAQVCYASELAVVNCPKYLNIRQTPDVNGTIIGLIENDAGAELIREGTDWCAIKSGGVTGYVMSRYLLIGDSAKVRFKDVAKPLVRVRNNTCLYATPNHDSAVWEKLATGTVMNVIEIVDGWVAVDVDGVPGYVEISDDVEIYKGLSEAIRCYGIDTSTGVRGDLVKSAMKYLGNEYVWGGNDPNTGVDCSGYVKYLYKQVAGIDIPRTSYTQCNTGAKISSTEMKPGDLIFYADSSGTVNHVSMYIGNGQVIHAASKASGIKISEWNYRTPKYIRRLLNE